MVLVSMARTTPPMLDSELFDRLKREFQALAVREAAVQAREDEVARMTDEARVLKDAAEARTARCAAHIEALVQRERGLPEREADVAGRESAVAPREAAVAQREALVAKQEAARFRGEVPEQNGQEGGSGLHEQIALLEQELASRTAALDEERDTRSRMIEDKTESLQADKCRLETVIVALRSEQLLATDRGEDLDREIAKLKKQHKICKLHCKALEADNQALKEQAREIRADARLQTETISVTHEAEIEQCDKKISTLERENVRLRSFNPCETVPATTMHGGWAAEADENLDWPSEAGETWGSEAEADDDESCWW